jgi:hypothetical protein
MRRGERPGIFVEVFVAGVFGRVVMRRSLAWVLASVLAVAGSQLAHALAYRIVVGDPAARAHRLDATGHGYLAYLPQGLGFATAVLLLALFSELRRGAGGVASSRSLALWPFLVLAPLLFFCQEHFERLAHDGAFPWGAVAEPTFMVGLALQLPFALAAYLIARLLLRAARSLGRMFASRLRLPSADTGVRWSAAATAPLRSRALERCWARGPPLPAAA